MAVRSGKKIKFKFVWTKELIFLIVGLVALITATIILALPDAKQKFAKSYAEVGVTLDKDHVFNNISYNKLAKKISNQSSDDVFYVFYGSTQNSTCTTEIVNINAAANTFEIDSVYYLDATFAVTETDRDAEFLAEVAEKEEKLGNVDLLSYPSLWVFKGGELVYSTDEMKLTEDSSSIEGTWKLAAYTVFGTNW